MNHNYPDPNFQPPNSGQPIPQHTQAQPTLHPTQPSGYVNQGQPALGPTIPQGATFNADAKVLELLATVHPELKSALINIAVKKFAADPDFLNFYVMDAYREHIERTAIVAAPADSERAEAVPAEVPAPEVDFGGW